LDSLKIKSSLLICLIFCNVFYEYKEEI